MFAYVVQHSSIGNHFHVTQGRYGPRVDTYRTQSMADYSARLLNAGKAEVHPHAVIGTKVWSR